MHDFKIWILIIWICLYFYCVQNPLKDWHGITRQDNLIGDMTWNSSSKHDCIAWASLHSSQILIVSECWASLRPHLYLSRNLSAWYHRSSVILPPLYWMSANIYRSKHVWREILHFNSAHIPYWYLFWPFIGQFVDTVCLLQNSSYEFL